MNGVIKIDASQIHSYLDSMVRSSVEDTLNKLLDEEADRLCNAGRYAVIATCTVALLTEFWL